LASFSIVPELVENGWSGTFKYTDNQVKVNFSSVPEPSVSILALAGACWVGSRRPNRKRTE
jgi:hypothetical protein